MERQELSGASGASSTPRVRNKPIKLEYEESFSRPPSSTKKKVALPPPRPPVDLSKFNATLRGNSAPWNPVFIPGPDGARIPVAQPLPEPEEGPAGLNKWLESIPNVAKSTRDSLFARNIEMENLREHRDHIVTYLSSILEIPISDASFIAIALRSILDPSLENNYAPLRPRKTFTN